MPGTIHGIIGENGAGKSTLVKIIAGNYPPSEGEIWLNGKVVQFASPGEARGAGIELVHQDLALCDNLPAAKSFQLSIPPAYRKE